MQFQGMIAEYERAQILERSRRGKWHRARAGEISVLSGAPYGYRYIRKTDDAPASYAVVSKNSIDAIADRAFLLEPDGSSGLTLLTADVW